MDANVALDQIGHFGRYQIYVFLVSCIPVFNSGLTLLSTVFVSGTPDHRCFIDECDVRDERSQVFALNNSFSIPFPYNSCQRYSSIDPNISEYNESVNRCHEKWFSKDIQSCDDFVFSKREFHSTIVTEWQLVCDQSWKVPMSQSVAMIGVLFGNLFFGQFSDRYGRKALFTFVPLVCLSSSILTSFAPNYVIFTILTAITAACTSGMSQASFILGIEFIGKKYRVVCANLQEVVYSTGTALLSLLAYEVRDWRPFQLILSIPIIITLVYPWLFPESVRWQASHGKVNNALITLRRAAKWNRILLNESAFTDNKTLNESSSSSDSTVQHYGPLDLFRNKRLRFWSMNLFVIWFIDSMIFYGLTFQSSSLGSNTYVTLAAISMVDIPANILVTIAMLFYGRKPVLFVCSLMAGLSCLATILVPNSSPLFTAIAIFGKSNIAASYTLMYIFSAEIFPTVIRSTSVGLCTVFSRVGGIIAPHLIELTFLGNSVPLVLCGVLSLICCVLAMNLPETFGKPLPDTFEDIESLGDKPKIINENSKLICDKRKYCINKLDDHYDHV